jgi:hypothetical protein
VSSFTRMSQFPVGYFRSTCSWLLRHRRTVARRIHTLNAEVDRIGFVTVTYVTKQEGDNIKATEIRQSISVTPGSTLEKLVMAYMANGGNPFDISPFAMPDYTRVIGIDAEGEPVTAQRYFEGGVLAPRSASYDEPTPQIGEDEEGNQVVEETGFGAYPGGMPRSARANAPRMGGRMDPSHARWGEIVSTMDHVRNWANQDIRQILTDIEWRIIKQMDLREQLEHERDDVLQQAFGAVLDDLTFDERSMNPDLGMSSVVQAMNEMLFFTTDAGKVYSYDMYPPAGDLGCVFPTDISEANRDAKGA